MPTSPEASNSDIRARPARAEFERRRRRDALARRRRFGRVLAAVVAGRRDPSLHRPLACGVEAEERVGRLLRAAVGDAGVVLHDRAVPRGRANIGRIAVVPSGVWVIDTKRYRRRVGPWARPFAVRGVTATWPGALAAALVATGPLDRDERSDLSVRLAPRLSAL